jgi:DNA recombination protein RmuC
MEILLYILIALAIIHLLLMFIFRPRQQDAAPWLRELGDRWEQSMARLQQSMQAELRTNREEAATTAKTNREELNQSIAHIRRDMLAVLSSINNTIADNALAQLNRLEEAQKANREELSRAIKDFTLELRDKLEAVKNEQKEMTSQTVAQLEKTAAQVDARLTELNTQAKSDNTQMRDALVKAFKEFGDTFDKKVNEFNELQRAKFADLEKRQTDLVVSTEKKLEEMRATVDEKLTKTLSDRLGESFETVGKQLIEVQKGLGEMQTIATDVGGLKKVLSNVKLRGGVGEVQLGMILEQILAPNQFDANVCTKAGSSEPVEYAIKLPGRGEDENSFVYLPIDAKFPKDTYEHLLAAYEAAIPEDIEQASRQLELTIRKMAKDIRDKYIDPPHTTDFAILFLPFESIYAEVIRRSALVDQLRDEFKITVAGPTTLMAILNSLQMGFRTLALQKRSSEVWKVLGAVKTEFETFGGMLQKAQKNIQTGLGQLDDVMGKRTRAIQRKLKEVESMPAAESQQLLPIGMEEGEDEELREGYEHHRPKEFRQ